MPAADKAHGGSEAADDLTLLLDAAAKAGAIAMRYFRKEPEVWLKSGNSPVSEADYAVDAYLRETLIAARPDYGWLSEETADTDARLSARRVFVVDPIDGTRGFLEGSDQWCVSIAIVEAGRSITGVLQCPARKQRFWAQAGAGAFLDGDRLKVTEPSGPVEIGGPKPMVDSFAAVWPGRVERVAYAPSLAYRIASIASGRIDATFIKPNSHDWDLAAADLILREAGGRILNVSGDQPVFAGKQTAHGALVGGSGRLLEAMQAQLEADAGS